MFRANVICSLVCLMAGLMGILPAPQANAQRKQESVTARGKAPTPTIATLTKDRLKKNPVRVNSSTLMAVDAKQPAPLSASALQKLTPSSRAPATVTSSFTNTAKLELLKSGGSEGSPESGDEIQTVTRLSAAKLKDGQTSLAAMSALVVGTFDYQGEPYIVTSGASFLIFRDMESPNRYLVEFSLNSDANNNTTSVGFYRKNTQYDQSTEGWQDIATSSHQLNAGAQSLAIIVDTTVNGSYIVQIDPEDWIVLNWVELTKLD